MLRADAPTKRSFAEIVAALQDYPVYDEDDSSNGPRRDYWKSCSVRERCDSSRTASGASIFATRRESLPQDDTEAWSNDLWS
jgi:hypothetical protein